MHNIRSSSAVAAFYWKMCCPCQKIRQIDSMKMKVKITALWVSTGGLKLWGFRCHASGFLFHLFYMNIICVFLSFVQKLVYEQEF